ncbi:hypothetical protein GCM10010431_80990 [Streptomyces kunmingensis]
MTYKYVALAVLLNLFCASAVAAAAGFLARVEGRDHIQAVKQASSAFIATAVLGVSITALFTSAAGI